jgi:hypothetical protein
MWDYVSINYKVYVCILADEVTELVANKDAARQ